MHLLLWLSQLPKPQPLDLVTRTLVYDLGTEPDTWRSGPSLLAAGLGWDLDRGLVGGYNLSYIIYDAMGAASSGKF